MNLQLWSESMGWVSSPCSNTARQGDAANQDAWWKYVPIALFPFPFPKDEYKIEGVSLSLTVLCTPEGPLCPQASFQSPTCAKWRTLKLPCGCCSTRFVQVWRDTKPAKLSFSPYSSTSASVPERRAFACRTAVLAEDQSMLLSAPRALKLTCLQWPLKLWMVGMQIHGKRVLTQGCEDLTLVSLNYPSPLAEHMPPMLWSCQLHPILMMQLCLCRFSVNLLQIKVSSSEKLIVMCSCTFNTSPLKIRYGFVITLWKMIVDYTKDCLLCWEFWVFFCLKYPLQGLVVTFTVG